MPSLKMSEPYFSSYFSSSTFHIPQNAENEIEEIIQTSRVIDKCRCLVKMHKARNEREDIVLNVIKHKNCPSSELDNAKRTKYHALRRKACTPRHAVCP